MNYYPAWLENDMYKSEANQLEIVNQRSNIYNKWNTQNRNIQYLNTS